MKRAFAQGFYRTGRDNFRPASILFVCKDQCLLIVSGIPTRAFSAFRIGFAHPLVPVFGPVLVRRYFSDLNRFCIRSPIVPWVPPGYTFPSIRRTSLTGSERRTTQRFSMRLPLTGTRPLPRPCAAHRASRRRRHRRGCRHRALRIPSWRRRKVKSFGKLSPPAPRFTTAHFLRRQKIRRLNSQRFHAPAATRLLEELPALAGEAFLTSFLLAHCGGGQDKPGCLGPSAKLPRHFFLQHPVAKDHKVSVPGFSHFWFLTFDF